MFACSLNLLATSYVYINKAEQDATAEEAVLESDTSYAGSTSTASSAGDGTQTQVEKVEQDATAEEAVLESDTSYAGSTSTASSAGDGTQTQVEKVEQVHTDADVPQFRHRAHKKSHFSFRKEGNH